MTARAMTGKDLFVELLHRLQHYSDAAVLWALLKNRADEVQFTTTAVKMAQDELTGAVKRWDVQRSIARLAQKNFIEVDIQPGTCTTVTVNRKAVLRLLRDPLPKGLPGLSRGTFSFLAAWESSPAGEPAAFTKLPQGM
jgi:hypothetical protein